MRTIIVIGIILMSVFFGIKALDGAKEKIGGHNAKIEKVMKDY